MTNEEFVEKKLSQKFDFFWEKALKKLSHGNEKFFSIRTENYRYYFNKISSRIDCEPCIVCKRSLIENGKEKGFKDRKVYSKKEFKEIYVKYEQYKKELHSVFLSGKEFVPDAYAGNFTCDKATKELYLLQRKYSIIFLRCIGLDVIKEQRCLYLNLDEIRDYICDAKRRYCNRYFEFQKFGLKMIQPLLDSPIEVILLDSKYERFITFCKEKCINDLTSLLFVPYYAVTLVNRFGASLIGSVLFDIKRYVKVQILFEKYVSLEDVEG